jgi:hypothetical protein
MTVLRVGWSGFEFRYGQEISSSKRLPVCGGCFLEDKTQNSHPSSTDFKNVWRYNSTPPTFVRGVHMDYEGGDTREQVTGQLNLPSLGLKSVLLHC